MLITPAISSKKKNIGFKKVILTRIMPNGIMSKYIDNVGTYVCTYIIALASRVRLLYALHVML